MIGQYLITFREVLEAGLIVSIILAYFIRSDQKKLNRYVYIGVLSAVLASALIALLVAWLYGGLSDTEAKLFEGLAAILAVAVLTGMIIWMAIKGAELKGHLQDRAKRVLIGGTAMGIVLFSFIVVFREGFETVLFLIPFGASDPTGTLAGALLGVMSALALSYFIFFIGIRIDLKRFFALTSVLLVLLAAGLLGYGVHELISYNKALTGTTGGWLSSYAFDLGISESSALHHKGIVGSIFAVMLGYSVKMEWGRILVHAAYLIIFLPLTILAYRNPTLFEGFNRSIRILKSRLLGFDAKHGTSENTDLSGPRNPD